MATTTPPARPASAYDPLALLDVVREVAEAADVEARETISTRVWDSARRLTGTQVDARAARRIAEHLGLPWRKVVEIAFIPGNGRSIALGLALNETQRGWLTPEYSDYVLRLIARRLGVTTLTPGQYRAEAKAMLARDRGAHRGQLRLPTADQIAALAGSWDRALAHAGLRARQGRGGHRARVGPVPIIEVLDRCYEHHGTEPTNRELERFARANGIPLPRRKRPWADYLREWKDGQTARGLAVPQRPPAKAQRPDYDQDVGAARPGERRAQTSWADVDAVTTWVARYLAELPRGRTVSAQGYVAWASTQDGAPWTNAFAQHGGWTAVLALARARLCEI